MTLEDLKKASEKNKIIDKIKKKVKDFKFPE